MNWYRIDFNSKQYINGIQNQLSEQLFGVLRGQPDSNEMVVLFRNGQGGDIYQSFYISPKAANLFHPLIEPFNPVECEEPQKYSKPGNWHSRIGFVCGDHPFFIKLYGNDL